MVRGGYGIFVINVGNSLLSTYEGGPFSPVSASFVNQLVNGAPLFGFPNPFTGTGPQASTAPPTVNGLNPQFQNPYVQQWNLTLAKQIANTGLRLSYIGTKGPQLAYLRNINIPAPSTTTFAQSRRPYPLYGNISYQENGGNSDYHALQVEGSRRLARDLTFNLAWTWTSEASDVDDNGNGVYGTNVEDPRNRAQERGRDSYAVRHRVVGNLIYNLPFGRNRAWLTHLPAFAEGVLGGWQLTALGTWQTGLWLTPSFASVDTTGTGITGGRPYRLADGSLPASQQTIFQWFDKNAFTIPPTGRYGNSGRGILEGPCLGVLHVGIGKDFRMFEKVTFNIQAAFQNILNHANFGVPNMTVNSSAGGSISSTITNLYNAGENGNGARSVQLKGRITF